MKTLYLECKTGVAGDMLLAALYELLPQRETFLQQLNTLGLPQVTFAAETAAYTGITGTHMRVIVAGEEEGTPHTHAHAHHHGRSRDEIYAIIDALAGVPGEVKAAAKAVYADIADAEAAVHGRAVDEVHFHELGTMDAVADVVGSCYAMHLLSVDTVVCSPISVGGGTVETAHGTLPVPAPATARLLSGMPCVGGPVEKELCTPTGAALIRHFVRSFGDLPAMRMNGVGYGFGTRDIGRPNCVRATIGESDEAYGTNGTIAELSCNVDDMTGEAAGYALERLFEAGALDACIVPIQMKKSRPGMLFLVLCEQADADALAAAMLKHTTTFGVRRKDCARYTLTRRIETVSTPYGDLRVKTGTGHGTEKAKVEYEDAACAARENGVSYGEVERAALRRD